jgi:hypothetical protein
MISKLKALTGDKATVKPELEEASEAKTVPNIIRLEVRVILERLYVKVLFNFET